MVRAADLSVDFKMIIDGGSIFLEDGKFQDGRIVIEQGVIQKLDFSDAGEKGDEEILDVYGMYVIPGFVDIHSHGCAGVDFCDATKEAFATIENYQLKNGITSVFPATMTLPEETLGGIFEAAGNYLKNDSIGVLLGITMEGPFISEEKKGAQNARYIQKPCRELFKELQKKSSGVIKQVAIAPEEEDALEFISEISKDVTVSLAHSTADYETASEAFKSGATHVTHLFNGMNTFSHREPGIVGAAFDNPDVYVEMICDGVHLHPSMVRAMFRLFGADRICMISDSIRATGMCDGVYSLGGQKVVKKGNLATLEDGTIAGSVCNLYECFRKAVKEMEIPLKDAILSCTKTPATSLGVAEKCGSIKEGRNADILIVDKELKIKYIIKNGKLVFKQEIKPVCLTSYYECII